MMNNYFRINSIALRAIIPLHQFIQIQEQQQSYLDFDYSICEKNTVSLLLQAQETVFAASMITKKERDLCMHLSNNN